MRERLNWKRAGTAAAPGYHAAEPERGPRLCFRLEPVSYDTASLIEVLEQIKTFYAGEPVVLVWDGLSAHRSRGMRAWAAEQDWLTLERLPAYAPELNPVELLWSATKTRELANLAGDHLADVADAATLPGATSVSPFSQPAALRRRYDGHCAVDTANTTRPRGYVLTGVCLGQALAAMLVT